MSLKDLIMEQAEEAKSPPRCAFLLGAGASVPAGIPATVDLVEHFRNRIQSEYKALSDLRCSTSRPDHWSSFRRALLNLVTDLRLHAAPLSAGSVPVLKSTLMQRFQYLRDIEEPEGGIWHELADARIREEGELKAAHFQADLEEWMEGVNETIRV